MRGHGAQRGKQYAVRSAAAVAGVAVAVAIVAGCASRSGLATRDDKSAGGAIQFAAAKVVSARSVHVHATIAGGFDATIDGSIVFAPALQADLTLKAAGSTSAGANADIANAAGLLPTHVIYDGTTIYFPIKPSDNVTSKDKPKAAWFGLNADKTVAKDSPELALLRTDPAALVKELLAKGTFAQAGSETVDGVATTRFGMDVAGDTPGHVDVWLDEAGLPVEIAGRPADTGDQNQDTDKSKPQKGRFEVHFSQWGHPVTIAAPPADEVIGEDDPASFAVPGRQFTISGSQLNGSDPASPGEITLPGITVASIHGAESDPKQTVCIPVPASAMPSPQASPTTICLMLSSGTGLPTAR
ncbi:hypothetical protein GCM10009839_18890 [Catenulispora yoronensis]|uniref:Uncharacterized protein n=1 Tax=Catenulispora yoronensis TaxID=450799 RepID=A0ABP5FA41_9ACTN